jgi:hypothetical protein
VVGTFPGLLRRAKVVNKIQASGLRLSALSRISDAVPKRFPLRARKAASPPLAVREVRLDNEFLDIQSGTREKPPLEFTFRTLVINNFGPK